jgi:CheY-like chemotaxis protein
MAETPVSTALIVDDNYYNRDLCRLALEHAGYSVSEAETGVAAVNILKDQTFDLLILDLAMPELNGLGVIRQINVQTNHKDMSIIVMTANPHMATEEVDLRVDFVLYKPIDILNFTALVQRLIKKPAESVAPDQSKISSNEPTQR